MEYSKYQNDFFGLNPLYIAEGFLTVWFDLETTGLEENSLNPLYIAEGFLTTDSISALLSSLKMVLIRSTSRKGF